GDISSLPEIEKNGGLYRDADGPGDLLAILRKHGMTHARLRIWNNPRNGLCGLAPTLAMARRLKQAEMPWLLDFHYSDDWADPAKQRKPAAWVNLHGAELEQAVFNYTREVIAELDKQGTPPFMVQAGNEITPGMLWDDGRIGGKNDDAASWKRFARLVKAGLRGVREGRDGKQPILTMIHLDAGGSNGACRWFFDHLLAEGAEFDVIGLSYYPWWHGDLTKLRNNLNDLAKRYGKDIIVVETAYPWSEKGVDRKLGLGEKFPASPEGQKVFLTELLKTVKQVPGGRGKGIFWWEPAWIPTPKSGSGWGHRGLFDNDGKLMAGTDAFGE
ncbi:MAG: glycosyl hydrolase 53 family protein, partial [Tepidisphaeraceae bacterium]